MSLHLARTTLQSTPPKCLIKMNAYEVVALLRVESLLIIAD